MRKNGARGAGTKQNTSASQRRPLRRRAKACRICIVQKYLQITKEENEPMMKRVFALLLPRARLCALRVGCAKQETPAAEPSTNDPAAAETTTDETPAADAPAEQEVLEFYHAYWHDEATWYPAVVMREIYQEFADAHADGPVRFEPIAIEDLTGLYSSELASGRVPDMMDCSGSVKLEGAIAQNVLMDLKPYIDENGLEAQVGANY